MVYKSCIHSNPLIRSLGSFFQRVYESCCHRLLPRSIFLLVFLGCCLSGFSQPIFAEPSSFTANKKTFYGKKITLNFQDIPIRSVLQVLADFTQLNIIVSDKVQGNTTLRLDNIPWDEALAIILKTNALSMHKEGTIIRIAPVAHPAQSLGQASLPSRLITIKYAKAQDIAAFIRDKNTRQLSAQGAIVVDKRTNSLWIQDVDERLTKINQLIQKLDVPVQQVLIESRIVDISRDCTEELGIRFSAAKSSWGKNGAVNSSNSLVDKLNLDLALPMAASSAGVGIALAKLADNILLDLELSALESEGKAEVIASPRLITANQQAAIIESGEEIPYQESTLSGATATVFKKAVLSLKVTPQITSNNKIMLELQINQDNPSARDVNGVPAISTKEIQTTVLVNNGQTIVLGGIYKQNKVINQEKIPVLGNIPILGALLSSKQRIERNEELLIFITPRIIPMVD